jgi:hypothetical protein
MGRLIEKKKRKRILNGGPSLPVYKKENSKPPWSQIAFSL